MIKRILMVAVLGVGGSCMGAEKADAGIFYRPFAPVRRVAARAVLPPYPMARAVVPGPVIYRPYVTPVYGAAYGPVYGPAYGPVVYGAPYMYGGGVSVSVGF